ncbi:hypothetical protein [Nitrococcus mobilis]|uniref:hypothetical protein n=1 Tax=Nitrococcus mobilis TaxID=35797 RepID=UPI0012EA88A2|nr:hypothetical protein [Nitrococcus mobilis]
MGKTVRAALEVHGNICLTYAGVPAGLARCVVVNRLHCKGGEAGLMSTVVRDLTGAFHRRVIGVVLGDAAVELVAQQSTHGRKPVAWVRHRVSEITCRFGGLGENGR